MADEDGKFTFKFVGNKKFLSFDSAEVKECLMKWGMAERMIVQMFSYDKLFQQYQKDEFVQEFLQDSQVQSNLRVISSSNTWGPLVGVEESTVMAELVPCSVTSMEFFDRLYSEGIVRESGGIKKCFDEYLEDFVISDELRKVLLLEGSEAYPIFTDADRKEFVFLVFKHLCLGGQVCQYEDTLQPYLDTTKAIYKDLISVHKNPNTKQIQVGSVVLKISAVGENKTPVYPGSHEQSFAYMCVDIFKRHVYVWYHCWS